MQWLVGGRQGPIPDGAMIIKEQYPPPSGRYAGLADNQLPKVTDWTVMIKDSKGSKDGWFWGEFWEGMKFDDDSLPFDYPWAGFGLYCLRCHSTAEKEYTFASLDNVRGFPGQPLTFPDDGSWRGTAPEAVLHGRRFEPVPKPPTQADPDFLKTLHCDPRRSARRGSDFPLGDLRPYRRALQAGRVSSSAPASACLATARSTGRSGRQCSCPRRTRRRGEIAGANVSPYGEWRWSPMGLAGRDPIFFAQLESEFAFLKTLPPPEG